MEPDEFGFFTYTVTITIKTSMPEIMEAVPETLMSLLNSDELKVEKVNVSPS